MLNDPRIEAMARVLVHYSLELRPGDLFAIAGQPVAAPLIEACYREALLAGAHPHLDLTLPGLEELYFQHADDTQLDFVSPRARQTVETFDARLTILSATNTRALSNVDPAKQARVQTARREIMRTFMTRDASGELRWSVAMFPTEAYAQDAEMSQRELADFIAAGCLLDAPDPVAAWRDVYTRQQRIVAWLAGKQRVHLTGPGTDLTFSTAGRTWINDDGKKNFPGGEIFTGPVEDSAEGIIRFTFPAIYQGKEVAGIALRFAAGKVVEASAEKNEALLHSLLELDEGARRIGEFAFGTNEGVTKFTRNTLFDEKIAGTVHLALGAGYPSTGARNQSALHWYMVCDLRQGGTVDVDGKPMARDGKFVFA